MANTSQRSYFASSGARYHFTVAQKVKVVNKVESAYTSPSTAENQTEVAKAVHKPATRPAAPKAMSAAPSGSPSPSVKVRAPSSMVISAISMAAPAEARPESMFTEKAIIAGSSLNAPPKSVKIRPISKNKGAPGGCTTSNL